MRKSTHQELVDRQEELRRQPKLPLTLLANNIRSLYNVGSLFRTADGVGAEKLWLCGITGIPPSSKISKTALDAELTVAWEYAERAGEAIRIIRNQGYEIVLLEQTPNSVPFDQYVPTKPVCLVVGNEIQGIEDSLLNLCDVCLEIPMAGIKNSLNVTVACGIAAYHLRNQLLKQGIRSRQRAVGQLKN